MSVDPSFPGSYAPWGASLGSMGMPAGSTLGGMPSSWYSLMSMPNAANWMSGYGGMSPNPMAPSSSFPMLGMWPMMGYGSPYMGGLFNGSQGGGSLATAGGSAPAPGPSSGRFQAVSGTGSAVGSPSAAMMNPYGNINSWYYNKSYLPNYRQNAALQKQGMSPGPNAAPNYTALGLPTGI